MKGTGAKFFSRACALIAAAMTVLPCMSGCLKVTGFDDRKEPIPLRDGGEDATDWLDVDADMPDTADGENELLDPDMDDDAADTEDFPDVHVDPDTEDRTDIEDIPLELDAPDVAELPPGLVWVSIPSGAFEMGCLAVETVCDDDEQPRHTVNVLGFEMTETEITQSQYEWVTGDTPSHFPSCGASCPVEQVNWYEAKAFCEAIGGRLPSEAEWEYAARAGTTTRYYCGEDEACLVGIAWYGDAAGSTHPVGEKTANAFGLYDMLGNVWEWVEDCWHADYNGAPSTGEVWSGGDCGYRVLRGGSWYDNGWVLRASHRYKFVPGGRFRDNGFRCARDRDET